MSDRNSDLRRRKIALYREHLGEAPPPLPEGKVDDLAYLHALADVAARAPPETALEIGAQRNLADLGVLGHLIASASDLSDTLDIWQKHANMAGELAIMRSEITGSGDDALWTLTFEPAPFLSPELARFTQEELTAAFFSLVKDATGADFASFTTELRYPAHPGVDYARYFPGPVHFERRAARISGPAAALHLPNRARDQETFRLLLSHVGQADRGADDGSLRQRLYDYFLSTPKRAPRLEEVAAIFGLSDRTLDRRLAAEGTSFARVLGEFRYAWARDLLRSDRISVAQIADLLGYRNENSFRRAFRQWSGAPIGAWRRSELTKRE